jgi:hypothetical protein
MQDVSILLFDIDEVRVLHMESSRHDFIICIPSFDLIIAFATVDRKHGVFAKS